MRSNREYEERGGGHGDSGVPTREIQRGGRGSWWRSWGSRYRHEEDPKGGTRVLVKVMEIQVLGSSGDPKRGVEGPGGGYGDPGFGTMEVQRETGSGVGGGGINSHQGRRMSEKRRDGADAWSDGS